MHETPFSFALSPSLFSVDTTLHQALIKLYLDYCHIVHAAPLQFNQHTAVRLASKCVPLQKSPLNQPLNRSHSKKTHQLLSLAAKSLFSSAPSSPWPYRCSVST